VGVGGNALNRRRHLAGAGREALQILADLLGDAGDGIGLYRSLARVDGDLLAGG